MARWLLKSEPDVFSYDDLVRAGREGWDGTRSYQSRIYLRAMRKGEQAIFYHSNAKPPGVAGICEIVETAEPDPTQFDLNSKYYDAASKPEDPRWDWVTVAPVRAQLPRETVMLLNVTLAGRVSATLTPSAALGPALVTTIV